VDSSEQAASPAPGAPHAVVASLVAWAVIPPAGLAGMAAAAAVASAVLAEAAAVVVAVAEAVALPVVGKATGERYECELERTLGLGIGTRPMAAPSIFQCRNAGPSGRADSQG